MAQKQGRQRVRKVERYERWAFRMFVYKLRFSAKSEKAIKEHFRLLEQTKTGDENSISAKIYLTDPI